MTTKTFRITKAPGTNNSKTPRVAPMAGMFIVHLSTLYRKDLHFLDWLWAGRLG
jgi:hypothetical protein